MKIFSSIYTLINERPVPQSEILRNGKQNYLTFVFRKRTFERLRQTKSQLIRLSVSQNQFELHQKLKLPLGCCKIQQRPGLCPVLTPLGSSQRCPDLLTGAGGVTPSRIHPSQRIRRLDLRICGARCSHFFRPGDAPAYGFKAGKPEYTSCRAAIRSQRTQIVII